MLAIDSRENRGLKGSDHTPTRSVGVSCDGLLRERRGSCGIVFFRHAQYPADQIVTLRETLKLQRDLSPPSLPSPDVREMPLNDVREEQTDVANYAVLAEKEGCSPSR